MELREPDKAVKTLDYVDKSLSSAVASIQDLMDQCEDDMSRQFLTDMLDLLTTCRVMGRDFADEIENQFTKPSKPENEPQYDPTVDWQKALVETIKKAYDKGWAKPAKINNSDLCFYSNKKDAVEKLKEFVENEYIENEFLSTPSAFRKEYRE